MSKTKSFRLTRKVAEAPEIPGELPDAPETVVPPTTEAQITDWAKFRRLPIVTQIAIWAIGLPIVFAVFLKDRGLGRKTYAVLLALIGSLIYYPILIAIGQGDDIEEVNTQEVPVSRSTGSVQDEAALPAPTVLPSPPQALEIPRFEVVERKDVSYDFERQGQDKAKRLALNIEIRIWPVLKEQVRAVADLLVEDERGKGWQAISLAMRYDRRETLPALAVLEWAPGGDWARASTGNPSTWAGYSMHQVFKPKMDTPSDCAPPPEEAFIYTQEFNQAIESNPDADEETVLRQIARKHQTTRNRVEEMVLAVDEWSGC